VITAGRSSHRFRSRLSLAFLLIPPLAWLIVVYLGSLAVLLVSALWSTNSFTGAVVRTFTGDNIVRVLTDAVFRAATLRTLGIALAVTLICITLAVPLALYMAKVASPRVRLALVVAVTTPLWASYLVKAYAWRMLLSGQGPLAWVAGYTPGYGLVATVGQLGANLWALRQQPSLADRLAAASGIAWVGLALSMIPAGLLWAVFPPPYVTLPGPLWLVLIPAVQVAVAGTAMTFALTLIVEVIVFAARAWHRPA
jgi:ABC-type spermidine/putrescine transport system permease subunit I